MCATKFTDQEYLQVIAAYEHPQRRIGRENLGYFDFGVSNRPVEAINGRLERGSWECGNEGGS
ncbi:hypothetical protein AAFP35_03735 [Gordonia sp. CPCC 206044]|uniref:hypothetical protein n=1 Tax=Gordonia sp. CPCC 206044 TaxID=3140793 RepID=UPI003AF3FB09